MKPRLLLTVATGALVLFAPISAQSEPEPSRYSADASIRFGESSGMDLRLEVGYLKPKVVAWMDLACSAVVYGQSEWARIYCGPRFHVRPWLKISLGAGVETDEYVWRLMAKVEIEKSIFRAHGQVEYGASGLWHHFRATFDIGFAVVGFASQRRDGEGLYLERKMGPGRMFALFLYSIESRLRFGPSETKLGYLNQITGYRLEF